MRMVYAALFASLMAFGFAANAYKAAGCGLGAVLFHDNNEWWGQTLAATTNGSSGTQTFGITTGTLECDANALIGKLDKTRVFVQANNNQLSNDIARGEGETLQVLAKIMNCGNQDAMALSLKANFSDIYTGSNDSAENVTVRIYNVMEKNNSCQPMG